MSSNTIFDKNMVSSHRTNTLRKHSHNQIKDQYTSVFRWLKPSKREIVHDPNQCGHLRQYINAKEKNCA
jgi:hypothetical protein